MYTVCWKAGKGRGSMEGKDESKEGKAFALLVSLANIRTIYILTLGYPRSGHGQG